MSASDSRPKAQVTFSTWNVTSAAVIVIAVIWAFYRASPTPVPGLPNYAAAIGNWRDSSAAPSYEHLRENLVWQWLFEISSGISFSSYLIQWITLSVATVVVLAFLYQQAGGQGKRALSVRLAILSPIVALFFGFFGSYDPVTTLLSLIMLVGWVKQEPRLVALGGILLGLQHFGQSIPMMIALGLTWSALHESRLTRKSLKLIVVGLVAAGFGKLLALLILLVSSSTMEGNRIPEDGLGSPLRDALVTSINFLPALVFSFLSGAWLIVALVYWQGSKHRRLMLAVAGLVCAVPSFLLLDQTRVFIILSFPSLALITMHMLRDQAVSLRQLRAVETLAWVCVPLFIWTTSTGAGRLQHVGALDVQIMSLQELLSWF